jgi:putative phosphoribosyl transferase
VAIRERTELRDRIHVFRDRAHAGQVLAAMLELPRDGAACLLAIPAGGVPVAAPIAAKFGLPLGVAVVSKMTLPWNTEVGYGAVAFDGSVLLNEELVAGEGLSQEEVRRGIERTREKVRRRSQTLCLALGPPDVSGRTTLLVDDGLASGFTMRAAARAVREAGASRIVVAVPTGSRRTVESLAPRVDELYCANVRGGFSFAVADAYEQWSDVPESEAARILAAPAPGRPLEE